MEKQWRLPFPISSLFSIGNTSSIKGSMFHPAMLADSWSVDFKEFDFPRLRPFDERGILENLFPLETPDGKIVTNRGEGIQMT